ncbi:TetR/AcrR family transcriptional regulator (plasmid) [Paroceanicella profunda]|uniref:TetR/AcrR family transcriptional regulator n=1 Tax=Paroceanicella profunda TaxID=2579971 RepID=A0A5B8G2U4_9RHOB|nr:TetR/AcrR family transcriptional regulator [Paroceanicella profunda]QDL94414.1 TetR/AcrR family transcriptional regulator [Paroceanicella profunda]
MELRGTIRPGGRSARVQASVHAAVTRLLASENRAAVTIPMIAAEAGVTPSTIYRRWGDLQELLADVAVERFRPDTPPADTGTARGDLEAWAEQYLEEMASEPGRAMIRDVIASQSCTGNATRCCFYTRSQIEEIGARAAARGEPFPDTDRVIDTVVGPIMYRILFWETPSAEQGLRLVSRLFAEPEG